MKVIDYIEKTNSTLMSYEIIPPLRGGNAQEIFNLVEKLMPYEPPFIDLTSRAAEVSYDDLPNGTVKRHIRRKRPGTIGLSAAIKNRFNVETVPHLLCRGFTREETEDALIELHYLGINNVLAVRGDELRKDRNNQPGKSYNRFTSDLVKQIKDMNRGKYLEEDLVDTYSTDFCIGVGGYPEKHFEAPNLMVDLQNLKKKIEVGADYIVTQMFFDNKPFFEFTEKARAIGIDVPIIPGIKIVTKKSHLTTIPKNFFVDIPEDLVTKITKLPKEEVYEAGVQWTLEQVQELVGFGVPCVHFYIMQDTAAVTRVVSEFK
ncbi:MAG: methylenetetrahydrofolate reductase [Fidelibacterota bacterium]